MLLSQLCRLCCRPVRTSTVNFGSPLLRRLCTKPPQKDKIGGFRDLLRLASPEKLYLAGGFSCLFVGSGIMLVIPYWIGRLMDTMSEQSKGGDIIDHLTPMAKWLAVVFVVGGLANGTRYFLLSIAGQRIVQRLRARTFSSLLNQDMTYFNKTHSGDLINRLSSDADKVSHALTYNISQGLSATARAVGGISMMVYTSFELSKMSLLVVPPLMLSLVFAGRYFRKVSASIQDSQAGATRHAQETLSNIQLVKLLSREEASALQYKKTLSSVLSGYRKEAVAGSLYWGSTQFVGNTIVLTVFYYGGLLMQSQALTIGDLTSFLIYAAFTGSAVPGVMSFYTETQKALGASGRIFEIIATQPGISSPPNPIPLGPLSGDVVFSDVDFAYPSRENVPVLQGLSLRLTAGQMTAVVGASGTGKSTLASLIMRLYDPQQGSVTIGARDLRSMSLPDLRSSIGVVPQEPVLFSTSVAENISYGAQHEVTREQIVEAAKLAHADEFINRLPEDYDSYVGERGVQLSGGQKQRVAIARALLTRPQLILLDEATSALDAESERLIQQALAEISKDRTVMVIAHRLATIKHADQIAVLEAGAVVEIGGYSELMALQGRFYDMVQRQTLTME